MTSWLLLKHEHEGRGEAVAIKGLEAVSNLPESDVDRLIVAKAVFNGNSSGDAAKSLARGGGVALRLLARQFRNVWPAAPLKKLSVETLTSLSGSYDGDSGDLLYALITFLSLAQNSNLIRGLPRDFAATGSLDSEGVVGRVKAVALKIEAALEALPPGSIVFYPRHRSEGETRWVDEAVIGRASDRGIELQAVEFIEEALAALGTEVLWWHRDTSPYRGLHTYQVEHSPIFFGRDDKVSEFLERLQQVAEAKRPGGLVEAPSGAGKSSFVQAGLLARLRILRRKAHTPVEYAVWQPRLAGEKEAREIDETLLTKSVLFNWRTHAGVNSTGFSNLNDLEDIHTLDNLGARLGNTALEDRLLVWVVDQFEELFTEKYSDAARVAFARFLAQLQALGVWVIATLRTEYKPRFMALADKQGKPLLVDVFHSLMFPLARMPVEALGQMITEPARVAGVNFRTRADGVRLDALLRQDALGADSMPLVGYALNQLWLQKTLPDEGDKLGRKTPQLTFEAYTGMGRLQGSIGTQAELAYNDLAPLQQLELHRLLRALVCASGPQGQLVPRSVTLGQDWSEDTSGGTLIDHFVRARLLIRDDGNSMAGEFAQVKAAHPALLTHWGRAAEYLRSQEDLLRTRDRLNEDALVWDEAGRADDALFSSDKDLADAIELSEKLKTDLSFGQFKTLGDCIASSLRHSEEGQLSLDQKDPRRLLRWRMLEYWFKNESSFRNPKRRAPVPMRIMVAGTTVVDGSTSAFDIFSHAMQGVPRVAVVGKRGAGKSATMVALARLTMQSPTSNRVPVYLAATDWLPRADEPPRSMEHWLVDELYATYKLKRSGNRSAQQLVDDHQLIPFVDGINELLEIEDDARDAKFDAFVTMLRTWSHRHPLVVACESSAWRERTSALSGTFTVVEMLPIENAGEFLADRPEIEDVVNHSNALRELCRTPLAVSLLLRLNLSSAAVKHQLETAETEEDALRALMQNAFESSHLTVFDKSTRERALTWIAKRLQPGRSFEIEKLEPNDFAANWLYRVNAGVGLAMLVFLLVAVPAFISLVIERHFALARPNGYHSASPVLESLVGASLAGGVGGLLICVGMLFARGWLSFGVAVGVALGCARGIVLGCGLDDSFSAFADPMKHGVEEATFTAAVFVPVMLAVFGRQRFQPMKIRPLDVSVADIGKRLGPAARWAIPLGLIVGLAFGVFAGWGRAISFGLMVAVAFETILVVAWRPTFRTVRPNQGIVASLATSLRVGGIALVAGPLCFGLGYGLGVKLGTFDWGAALVNAALGMNVSLIVLLCGALPVVQHYALRLTARRIVPWRLVDFCEECVRLGMLNRAGNRYQFAHDVVRKYFADGSFSISK